jgi:hypothetical protein
MRCLLACSGLVLALATSLPAQPPEVVGRWRVTFTLSPLEERALSFHARPGGQGTFLLLAPPGSDMNEPPEPTAARWETAAPGRVTFSGEVAFPIGNVGRDPGTLVFKGGVESADSIKGWVGFFKPGQDVKDPKTVPARAGSFTARREGEPSPR